MQIISNAVRNPTEKHVIRDQAQQVQVKSSEDEHSDHVKTHDNKENEDAQEYTPGTSSAEIEI